MTKIPTMQQIEISNGKLSNPITRSLGLSVDAPLSAVISRKINEYPDQRKRALEELNADLEKKYQEAESKTKDIIAQRRSEHTALEIAISTVSKEIKYYNTEIESLSLQIEKDTRTIKWINIWRVIWGILCTVGIIVVVIFTVVGFVFKLISFFIPSDDNKDGTRL